MKDVKTANRNPKPINKSKGKTTVKTFPHGLKIRRTLSTGVRIANKPMREYQRLDSSENPTQYAHDRSVQAAADTARTSVRAAKSVVRGGKKAIQKMRERKRNIKRLERDIKQRPPTDMKNVQETPARSASYRGGKQHAIKAAQRNANARSAMKNTAKGATNTHKAAKGTVKAASKAPRAAIKATKRTASLTARTVKTTAKTAQAAVRTTQAAAKAAARAVQTIKAMIKAVITAAKLAAKAIIAAVKALVVAVKAFIAFLAAGGWIVVLIVIVAALLAWLVGSAFGIFFSEENEAGALTQAVIEIQTKYTDGIQAEIDSLSASGAYDAIEVHYDGDYDGDSSMVNNWNDVLAVYAVRTMSEGDEVLTMTPEKQAKLNGVFFDMNPIAYRTEVENETYTNDENEEVTTTTLHIYVTISSKDYLQGAALYNFDAEQIELLEEMMTQDFYDLYAKVLQVDVYGGSSRAELLDRVNNLPAGTKGTAIVQGAAKRVGTPYSTLDCSKLVQTVYAEVGVSLPRTSVEQAKYCYNNGYTISASQMQPGDLIFWSKNTCKCGRWQEIHHTGIYIGNGQIIDASSAKGRVVLRDVWSGSTYSIVMYARPGV
ncbi:NlpC/P60 family protein [Christensenellaceae bacterium OttesenSCG-928-M15]|nr:NlpC/P60 family protein [Christensenellaceae bacterium OttesenSCG-928-M15]